MKNIASLVLLFCNLFSGFYAQAQLGIINTIAGNGTSGYSGDGGSATAASLNQPVAAAFDSSGNMYIADAYNNIIRKINSSGVISTFAGNGTAGYSGDGGLAVSAELNLPVGIAVDGFGNVYIADITNAVIRIVNHTGFISTFAGNGTTGYSGDGGQATAATLNQPQGLAFDGSGNLYIADFGVIRKVNSSGIITTIAGNGTPGYSGDGGPATAAELGPLAGIAIDRIGNIFITDASYQCIRKINSSGIISTFAGIVGGGYIGDGGPATAARFNNPIGITTDALGNVYIADEYNNRIRKVNYSGIISTIAGNGIAGFSGDGGNATAAELSSPSGVVIDHINHIHIADLNNNRIRRVDLDISVAIADSFSVNIANMCSGINFNMSTNHYSAGQHFITYFGNGQHLDTLTSAYGSTGLAFFTENYSSSGTYTIKHVLYNGSVAIDSITYSHNFTPCQNFNIKFYFDVNGDCVKDSSENFFGLSALTEIDSNGIAVDTVSSTSGFSYVAYGNPGDIYSFRVLNTTTGTHVTCPSTSVIFDTLFIGTETTKYFAVNCDTVANFNLWVNACTRTGRHQQVINLITGNTFCTPEISALSFNFSPNYHFSYGVPTPTSVIGNTVTWDMSSLSYINSPQLMYVHLEVPGAWLLPGDTIMSNAVITPTIGDYDSTNNHINRVDTVKSSFDPNEIAVLPSGCIPASTVTNLQYSILFENTGNDTAHNIYVMDTLSDNLASHSIRIVAASHTMNTSRWYDTSIHHNIIKFDFPGINLLDSSHHGFCDGMVLFTINTNSGLSAGTTISNHAGIFFDDNPVVMTNYIANTVGCGTLNTAKAPTAQAELYPNPATDELIIKTDPTAFTTFTISNIMGQEQLHQTLTTATTKVNISNLATGLYYVTFKGEGGELVKKLVKMK